MIALKAKKPFFNYIRLLLVALLIAVLASGCAYSNDEVLVKGKVNVVTSFYPLYDFAQKIGGEFVHVVNLVPAGVEPHDWTPKAKDMKNIVDADSFIYNGADFEGWVHDFLDSIDPSEGPLITEASKGADFIVIGEAEEGAEHEDEVEGDHADEGDDHGHGSVDPHIWLSPLQAKVMAQNVRDALIQVDAANQSAYESNYAALEERLDALDTKLKTIVANSPRKEIVVSHEAFGYIARDYGITQVGVMGLSPEAEPTPQRMKEIRDFAEKHDIRFILFEELVSSKLAETLAESLGIKTLVLNPLEGLTEAQQNAGDDYFTLMENNLTTIEKALQLQ